MSKTADYIIVGGGIGGCVVASLLSEKYPSLKIVLIEAGPDVSQHPLILNPTHVPHLQHSELDWDYKTVPQKHLDGKVCFAAAGKALGGGSAINASAWVRGDRNDYNEWAALVGDNRWSYEGMLPYFKGTESHHVPGADPAIHGFSGPVHTASNTLPGHHYPLREQVAKAWKSTGLQFNPDANSGNPIGFADMTKNVVGGKRALTSRAYNLSAVQVLTGALVKKVVVEDVGEEKAVRGVELESGEIWKVRREVIVSAGAYRTPQLLMLSGIGPKAGLERLGIEVVVELPVGENLHDHFALNQWWKLKDPEKGYAVGHPSFNDPLLLKQMALDYIATLPLPHAGLKTALSLDTKFPVSDTHPLLYPTRAHIESFIVYAGVRPPPMAPTIPLDGTHIRTCVLSFLPTSRGSVTLKSADPRDDPVIDPEYYKTELDRYVLREGLRIVAKMMREASFVEGENAPGGLRVVSEESTDAEIDERVRFGGDTLYHAAGTASMGKVVDPELRVYGVKGLRVCDASVMPIPLASHYQACIYAIGEQAADMI